MGIISIPTAFKIMMLDVITWGVTKDKEKARGLSPEHLACRNREDEGGTNKAHEIRKKTKRAQTPKSQGKKVFPERNNQSCPLLLLRGRSQKVETEIQEFGLALESHWWSRQQRLLWSCGDKARL